MSIAEHTEPELRDMWQDMGGDRAYLDSTTTPDGSPVSLTLRALLAPYLTTSSGKVSVWEYVAYRTYHAAGTPVPEMGPWIEVDRQQGWDSEAKAKTWAENKLDMVEEDWDPERDAEYAAKVEQVTAVRQAQAARDDRQALDDIAALLGTPDTWDGAADFLDSIAEIVVQSGRPLGSLSGEAWLRAFRESTGRPYVGGYDRSED